MNRNRIIVCVKCVPDPKAGSPSIDPVSLRLKRLEAPLVINPLDRHAIEEALRLKKSLGGTVVCISMGPPAAEQVMKECLALGADEAFLLSDRIFAGADTLATARCLAAGIKKLGEYRCVLSGAESSDGSTGQVPAQLAEIVGIPFVSRVCAVEAGADEKWLLTCKSEEETLVLEMALPGMVSVGREINKPAGVNFMGIMKARSKQVTCWKAADLGLLPAEVGEDGSPTRTVGMKVLEQGRQATMLEGTPAEMAGSLIRMLYARGVL